MRGQVVGMLPLTVMALLGCASSDGESARLHSSASTVADSLVVLGRAIHQLEKKAAILAIADPTGETEGDENLEHALYASSLAVFEVATQLDSTSVDAWAGLGLVLAAHSYRGFGEWDSIEVIRAVGALGRASRLAGDLDHRRPAIDSALAAEQQLLEGLRRR